MLICCNGVHKFESILQIPVNRSVGMQLIMAMV